MKSPASCPGGERVPKTVALLRVCREERIEVAGALGKAQVLNSDLDALEHELEAAHRAGHADAFCLYLYGLILSDRQGAAACLYACCALLEPCGLNAAPCSWLSAD